MPLRQRGHEGSYVSVPVTARGAGRLIQHVRPGQLTELGPSLAAHVARGVHECPPDPAFDGAVAAKLRAAADGPRKRFLHGVVRKLCIPDDRLGHPQQPVVALLVHRAEPGHDDAIRIVDLLNHLQTTRRPADFFTHPRRGG